jgi:hypothetical protein
MVRTELDRHSAHQIPVGYFILLNEWPWLQHAVGTTLLIQ